MESTVKWKLWSIVGCISSVLAITIVIMLVSIHSQAKNSKSLRESIMLINDDINKLDTNGHTNKLNIDRILNDKKRSEDTFKGKIEDVNLRLTKMTRELDGEKTLLTKKIKETDVEVETLKSNLRSVQNQFGNKSKDVDDGAKDLRRFRRIFEKFGKRLDVIEDNLNITTPEDCPYNSTLIGSECFSAFIGQSKTWSKALQFCKDQGGHMPVFDDKDLDFQDLKKSFPDLHSKTSGARYVDLWLDATDSDAEGTWKWGTGVPLLDNDSRWAAGQPNNWSGRQDCLVLEFDTNSGISVVGLEDEDCTLSFDVICEFNR